MSDMLRTLAAIVAHTPGWVWVLYALLLLLGLQRTRDSTVPLWRLLILPVAVTLLALSRVIGADTAALAATLLGLVAGSVAGWPLERAGATRRLPDGRLWLRGEWLSFVQIVIVLAFRYATSVASAMNPALDAAPTWRLGTHLVSATLSGLFLGRTAARLRACRQPLAAQHER